MLRTLTIALALASFSLAASPAGSAQEIEAGDAGWLRRIVRPRDPGPAAGGASQSAKPIAAADVDARAESILREHAERLFGSDRSLHPRLRHERSRSSLSGHQVIQRQTVRGIPVEGGQVMISMDRRGRMLSISNEARPRLWLEDPVPAFGPEEAIQIALARLGGDLVHHGEPRAELVVLPDGGGRLAYRVQATMYRPYIDLFAHVDAKSGEILRFEDAAIHEAPVPDGFGMDAPAEAAPSPANKALVTGTGLVFPANPLNGHPERYGLRDGDSELDDYGERVDIERLDGSGYLRGQYVDVTNGDQDRAYEPSLVYDYSSLVENGPFQEVNSYWHVDVFQNYLSQTLGLIGAKDVVQELLVHGREDDQSSYFTGSGHIDLGDGGVDDSEDGEIVIHEYGHALHDYISGIDRSSHENMALSEGLGDYLAASFGDNPLVGEWDATSYNPGPPPFLRRTDLSKVYPRDMESQVHRDGEIISAAWWEMNRALGQELADMLVVESLFLLPFGGGFVDYANATLLVDDSLNDRANWQAILTAYENHGILPTSTELLIGHAGLKSTDSPGPYVVDAVVGGTSPLRASDPVQLHYRMAGELNFTTVSMTAEALSHYRGELPAIAQAEAQYQYIIEAFPETGSSVRSPRAGVHSFSISLPELSVLHEGLPDTMDPGPYAVEATVTGAALLRAADPVLLHHRLVGESTFTTVVMSTSGNDLYFASIPDPGMETAEFEYYIAAHPETGDPALSPASGYHSFALSTPPVSSALRLEKNIPNPFNPETEINFSLPVRGRASLRIYDVAGRLVRVLFDETMPAGPGQSVMWNGTDDAGRTVSSGVYFSILEQGGNEDMRKMVMVR